MMTVAQLKEAIVGCGDSVYFTYHGKSAGIEPTVKNSVFTFELWYGDENKIVAGFRTMVSDRFFDGKSILEIMNQVELDFR